MAWRDNHVSQSRLTSVGRVLRSLFKVTIRLAHHITTHAHFPDALACRDFRGAYLSGNKSVEARSPDRVAERHH